MRLLGANPAAKVTGGEELPGKANYFIGNDPKKWRVGVPAYARVRYTGIHPGIDLVYYGNQQQVEFDFVVAPGADPSAIALDVGAGSVPVPQTRDRPQGTPLRITPEGDLVIRTRNGEVRFHKPVVYQEQSIVDSRQLTGESKPWTTDYGKRSSSNPKSKIENLKSVEGHFLLDAQNRVHFELGPYDHTRPLVIDPALAYSTFLGGSGQFGDKGNAIAVDSAGNVYVAGQTYSTDFPLTPEAYQTTNHAAANQSSNVFITKLNATGTALVYSTYLGGSGTLYGGDIGHAIAVDADGNAYVVGQTLSTDFPVTQGAFQTTNRAAANDDDNAFVTKLNPAGEALVYSTYLGGSGGIVNQSLSLFAAAGDSVNGLAIDGSGNVYVAGSTASADFPVTQGAYQTTNHDQAPCAGGCVGGYNAFVTELNSTGSALTYSTYLGGRGLGLDFALIGPLVGDQANGLALDPSGNVYVTGSAQSFDFPVTASAFQMMVASWSGNAFVAKLNMGTTSIATTPTVTVTPSASTITSGKPLTVAISVSGGSGNPAPTGTVTLASGDYASLATALAGGAATLNVPAASLANVMVAMYVPDAASTSTYNFSSGVASINVVGPNILVTPSSSSLTWAQAQSQALPVSIALSAASGYPTPTGTVSLTIGSWTSAAAALSGGNATVSIPPVTLPLGFDALNLNYSGDSNYAAIIGVPGSYVTVGKLAVSVAPASSSINMNQALAVTITVSEVSGGPTPTGTVTLNCGGYASAATPLANGSATITIPGGTLLPGTDILGAGYTGGNYASASGQATVTVTGTPSFSITGTAVTLTAGAATGNTSTITVTPAGGFTGSVALTAAITSSPSGAQDLPTLSFGSTSPVSIPSLNAQGIATLTISTTAPVVCAQDYRLPPGILWCSGAGAALACLLLFGIPAWRRRRRIALAALALAVTLGGGLLACGGGSSCALSRIGTTSGSYTITVTGTSAVLSATGTVTLTVQ